LSRAILAPIIISRYDSEMLTGSSLHLPYADAQGHQVLGVIRSSPLRIAFLIAVAVSHATTLWAGQLPSSADQFSRDLLRHEVEVQTQDHALWSYREQKQDHGKRKLVHVYQTNRGEIERLVSINDQPLSAAQVEAEDHRIQALISQPTQMRQHQEKQREDSEQARNLLRMFPDAFRFQYDGMQGSLVRLKFTPNPKFHPPDHAAQVFHHMSGTMLVDAQQERLAAISGTLTSEVKFFGGVFGHLEKGGTFAVQQQEVSPHTWEVTTMHVHMNGRALLFKTIAVQEDESYTDFHPVPANTTLPQAAELLKQYARDLPRAQAKN
jgi:hypothetical protein